MMSKVVGVISSQRNVMYCVIYCEMVKCLQYDVKSGWCHLQPEKCYVLCNILWNGKRLTI